MCKGDGHNVARGRRNFFLHKLLGVDTMLCGQLGDDLSPGHDLYLFYLLSQLVLQRDLNGFR